MSYNDSQFITMVALIHTNRYELLKFINKLVDHKQVILRFS